MLCSNCGEFPPSKASRKGYCATCAAKARDMAIKRFQENEERRIKIREDAAKLIQQACSKAEDEASSADEKPTISYVVVRPGTASILRYMKNFPQLITVQKARRGSGCKLLPPPTVHPKRQWAWADAMASVLREAGINAVADFDDPMYSV